MKTVTLGATLAALAAGCMGAGGVALAGQQYMKTHSVAMPVVDQATAQAPQTPEQQRQEMARLNKRRMQTDVYCRTDANGAPVSSWPYPKVARQKLQENPNDAMAHRTLAQFYGTQHGQFLSELRESWAAVRCDPDNPYDITDLAGKLRYLDRAEALRLLSAVAQGKYDDDVRRRAGGDLKTITAEPVTPPHRWLAYYGIAPDQIGPIQQEERTQAAAFKLPPQP